MIGTMPDCSYASISHVTDMRVRLHSTTYVPQPFLPSTGFWDVIRGYENQTLWENFHCDGDGTWIRDGLVNGSLVIVHDGSYMPQVVEDVCSAAIMIYCRDTKLRVKGTIVEQSPAADNYRAEILGGVLLQLVLRAASRVTEVQYLDPTIHCDNKGVANHGNSAGTSLPEKQAQADVLRSFKQLIRENPFRSCYAWVEGHSVKRKGWANCNTIERINDKVDHLAKLALLSG